MLETIEFQGKEVEIKRRARRKGLSLSVQPDGKIQASVNNTFSRGEILKFLQHNGDWLEKAIDEARVLREKFPPKLFRSGESYPYLGNDYGLQIREAPQLSLKFQGDQLHFSIPMKESQLTQVQRDYYFQVFKQTYKKAAQQIMSHRIRYYAQKMRLHPSAVSFRGQKTIWGSCSSQNRISLNYKLIVAPIEVVDYVLIHELAHIRHKDHSKSFWNLVEKHTEYRTFSRNWLRKYQCKADFLD